MALGVNAPSVLEPHIKAYRENIKKANPVGQFVNNQWLSGCFGLCGEDNHATRELCAQSLKTFFGPGRPYVQDQKDIYSRLLEQWGGVPEHLAQNFSRYIEVPAGGSAPEPSGNGASAFDLSGGSALAQKIWEEFDADTMAERASSLPVTRIAVSPRPRFMKNPGWTRSNSSWPLKRWDTMRS